MNEYWKMSRSINPIIIPQVGTVYCDSIISMSNSVDNTVSRIGLIAGEGLLPVQVAENATRQGIEVVPFVVGGSLVNSNHSTLKTICKQTPQKIVPGLVNQALDMLKAAKIQHLVFAGKVNKWILLRDPRIDTRALEAMKAASRLGDDDVMRRISDELALEGITVLNQTRFLDNLFLPEGTITQNHPDDRQWKDIAYGFEMAKEMGRLDIGQTVVVNHGMMIAVEAIEGTDECLKRGGKLAGKKGGVVVKVAKPDQDQRFDVPTVGLRTLKTMKQSGLTVLATEAGQTLFLEPEEMATYANHHGMVITCVQPKR